MIFFLQHTLFAYSLCFFVSPLFSMEITESEKPTITAQLYINQQRPKNALYFGSKEHANLTAMGIVSCIQYPLIAVTIKSEFLSEEFGRSIYLSGVVPGQIRQFETDQYKARGIEITEEIRAEIAEKKFPTYMPAHCLCCAKTGTVLSFTMHGYPVQLTCCDVSLISEHQLKKIPFAQDYDACMTQFVTKPLWMYIDDRAELIEHGLIKEIARDNYIHGEKGFVSMQKLIRELLHEKSRSIILLLWLFWKS